MSSDPESDATLVAAVREGLDLSVETLAQLVGCHSMTIYKWGYGTLSPNPYQRALLCAFRRAADLGFRPGKGRIAATLANDGISRALYAVLRHADLDAKLARQRDGTHLVSFETEP